MHELQPVLAALRTSGVWSHENHWHLNYALHTSRVRMIQHRLHFVSFDRWTVVQLDVFIDPDSAILCLDTTQKRSCGSCRIWRLPVCVVCLIETEKGDRNISLSLLNAKINVWRPLKSIVLTNEEGHETRCSVLARVHWFAINKRERD